MGNLTGSPIADYVAKQIDIRQKLAARNPEVLDKNPDLTSTITTLHNNNKTPWIRLASSVDVIGENILDKSPKGSNLAKGFVLTGGITNTISDISFSKGGVIPNSQDNQDPLTAARYSYGLGNLDYGLTPTPGIESVSIQHLNRGAIRKFQIRLAAQNKDQMALLESLYLRLGYYMLLEWGHSTYIDNSYTYQTQPPFTTTAFNNFFEGKIDTDIESAILSTRKETGGNYDGALFKVDNYSWSINKDGSYDITLSGVSKGGLIDSLTIGNFTAGSQEDTSPLESYLIINPDPDTKREILKQLETIVGEGENLDEIYKKTVATRLANGEYQNLKSVGAIEIKDPNSISSPDVLDLKSAFENEDDNVISTILNQNKSFLNKYLFSIVKMLKAKNWETSGENKRELYKKGVIRETIESSEGPPEVVAIKFSNPNNEENANEYSYITLGALLSCIKEKIITGGNNANIKISDSYEDNLMFTHWFQHSTDPRICLIPFDFGKSSGANEKGKKIIADKNESKFPSLNDILTTSFRKDGKYQGKLMAIHVNIEYITQILEETTENNGEISLYTFLDKLLYGIQGALGNINNFTITYDDENGLNIKDDTIIPGLAESDNSQSNLIGGEGTNYKPGVLRLYGTQPLIQGNFVTNVSIQSKVTNKLATQIAIGSTASGNDINSSTSLLARWNEGLIDRVQKAERDLQKQNINENTEPNSIEQELKKKHSNQLQFLLESYTNFKYLGSGTYEKAAGNLSSLLEYDLGIKTLNGSIAGKGFIPIDLSIEMEGLSGILLYQKLLTTEEILPKSYAEKIDFIVMSLDHSIDRGGWNTTINTLSVPKKKKFTSTSDKFDTNGEFSLIGKNSATGILLSQLENIGV